MKKNVLRLKINNPCTERWDEMHNDNLGRHCASCNKVVIDFSQMSESQIIEQFKNAVGKICGRFHKDQLQVAYVNNNSRRRAPWYNKFFVKIALTSLLTLKLAESDAQANNIVKEQVKDDSGKNKNKVSAKKTEEKKFISGKISDQDSRGGISGATVTILNSDAKATTDLEGKFKIEVPADYKGKEVIVKIYAAGYDGVQKKFKVSDLPRKELLVLLNYKEKMLMGDVAPDWQDK